MKVIVKDKVIEDCTSGVQLSKIDLDSDNLKKPKSFVIGFVTDGILKELVQKDLMKTDARKMFHENVKKCITTLINKLNERSPLQSVVVRNAVVFDPVAII